jgi:Bacterial TSP3 repeat
VDKRTRLRSRGLTAAVVTAVVGTLALSGTPAVANGEPYWETQVGKIPSTAYTRDAKVLVADSLKALVPYVSDKVADKKIEPVVADVGSRYFDGARLKGAAEATAVFANLEPMLEYLEDEMSDRSVPKDAAERAHVRALVETLTAVRLLADAAIQDAEATIGPFRRSPPPAPAPDATLLKKAFDDLKEARSALAEADEQLREADPEDALEEVLPAWRKAFGVLGRFGITYAGDHDADGVVDVVELRFGASPLLVDSDGDGLTDEFEIYRLAGFTVPSRTDTDTDGTADGQEDVDGDGLTNLREQELGTSPTEADTDGDGVDDGTEVAQGRNPLVADPRNDPPLGGGAPPIVPAPTLTDTDGDGLLDVE